MFSVRVFFRPVAMAAVLAGAGPWVLPALADDGFPFGFEMTLNASPQPGSKRIPTLEIGDHGQVKLDLWCKSGAGQFSVAGNKIGSAAHQECHDRSHHVI